QQGEQALLGHLIVGLGLAGAGRIPQTTQALRGEALPPFANARQAGIQTAGNLTGGDSLRGKQDDPRPLDQTVLPGTGPRPRRQGCLLFLTEQYPRCSYRQSSFCDVPFTYASKY